MNDRDLHFYGAGLRSTCAAKSYCDRNKTMTEEQLMWRRDRQRQANADRGGYKPPPPEADCPKRPKNGLCQLCRRFAEDRARGPSRTMTPSLDLDHCHTTGRFRGWLCWSCNEAMGKIEKNVGVLRLQTYLATAGLEKEISSEPVLVEMTEHAQLLNQHSGVLFDALQKVASIKST
jgi:Recombination endonuclease VII